MSELSLDELISKTTCVALDKYRDQDISIFTVGLTIRMESEALKSLNADTFHVHLDISKKTDKAIKFNNITPIQALGYRFFDWLDNTGGRDFVNSYVEKLYHMIDQSKEEDRVIILH